MGLGNQALDEEKGTIKTMRKLHILALALVAVFAFAAISVASAGATEWLLEGLPITSPDSVNSELIGFILLQDHGAFTEPALLCGGTDEGTVGPGAVDTETVITVTSCVADSGECKNPIVKAIDLPWKTELVLIGAEIRDKITAGGKGEPGYETTCETFIGTLHDTCKTELGSAKFVKNVVGGVELEFDAASEPSNCSLGGAKSGLIVGIYLILALTGTLTIS